MLRREPGYALRQSRPAFLVIPLHPGNEGSLFDEVVAVERDVALVRTITIPVPARSMRCVHVRWGSLHVVVPAKQVSLANAPGPRTSNKDRARLHPNRPSGVVGGHAVGREGAAFPCPEETRREGRNPGIGITQGVEPTSVSGWNPRRCDPR